MANGLHWEYAASSGLAYAGLKVLLQPKLHKVSFCREGAEAGRARKTILLSDDEPAVRKLVRLMLERSGYSVLSAGGSREAIRLSGSWPGAIDLLVTDISMPELDGRALAYFLRTVRPGIKVLYISGYPLPGAPASEFDRQTSYYLQKPFTAEALSQTIQEIFDEPAGWIDNSPGN